MNALGFVMLIKFTAIRSRKGHMKELHLGVSQVLLEEKNNNDDNKNKRKKPGLFSTPITHTTSLRSAAFLWHLHIRVLKVFKVF